MQDHKQYKTIQNGSIEKNKLASTEEKIGWYSVACAIERRLLVVDILLCAPFLAMLMWVFLICFFWIS